MLSKLGNDFAPAEAYVGDCARYMDATSLPYTQELIVLLQSRENEDNYHRG